MPALVEGAAEQEPTVAILKPVMPNDRPESEISKAMRVWLDGRLEDMSEEEECRLILFLWTCCEGCARGLAAGFPGSEIEDLASDYLTLIKLERKHYPCPVPRQKSGLVTHMNRVLKQELDPAWAELRQLLSEALWELEKRGHAKCLGGTGRGVRVDQRTNTKFTEWATLSVTNAHEGKPPAADLVAFFKKADSLPHFYPPRANRWHASHPRVIAPKDAEKLAVMLLDCADGWVRFDNLLAKFCEHVHLLEMIFEPESTADDEDQNEFVDQQAAKHQSSKNKMGLRHPPTEDAFWELVLKLAKQGWDALRADNLTTITCQYLLAKELLERKANLEEFGAHSTVFDKKKQALAILKKVLMADEFLDAYSEISDWHDKLWTEVLRCLAHSVEFCNFDPENPDSGAFKQE